MMEKIKTLLPIALLGLITSCAAQTNTIEVQDGSIVEQENTVEYFNKVDLAGGGELFISQSPETTLKIVGSSTCLSLVNAEVDSETLVIKQENNNLKDCQLKYYVRTPELVSIQQGGGGNVKVNAGFDVADSFRYVLNGGGNVDMKALKVNLFSATINGGGTMLLNVDKQLKAEINGGGTIGYQGNPEVLSNISAGGGSINKISQ